MKQTMCEVLTRVVDRLGGAKGVAIDLWPQREVGSAHRHLLACLNGSRKERLSPNELVELLRLGRECGVHDGMEYLMQEAGYEWPGTKEKSSDETIRQFEETTDRIIERHFTKYLAPLTQMLAAGAQQELRSTA